LLGGVRPQAIDWVEIREPGWFVADGWALTPEAAGVADRERRGPSRGGSTAWVRRRTPAMNLLVGGRNLGTKGEPDVTFRLDLDGRRLHEWTVAPDPGFFLHVWSLPEGALAGEGPFAKLTVTAEAADGSARPVGASVEQFDVQPGSEVIRGFETGWHEMEYAPPTGLRWRWTSDTAVLRVVSPAGADLAVTIRGEGTLRYFDQPSRVRVLAGTRVVGEFDAARDFEEHVRVPADAVAASGGRLTLETSQTLVPHERWGNGDRRRLGVRVYDVLVDVEHGGR
jgi:hypothetical protein